MRKFFTRFGIYLPRRSLTLWEWQIGPLWGTWPKLEYWRYGCRPTIAWDKEYWNHD